MLPAEVGAAAGALNGPVSREQPGLQPVAAGPTKVGETSPKLEVLTCAVAVTPVNKENANSKIAIENEIACSDLRGISNSYYNVGFITCAS